MKRIAAKFLAVMAMAITTTASVFGQNGFSYQAVIRNAEGELITNKQVEVKFTLKHDGTNFYSEKQNVKTNEYGNIQVVVGNGEKIDGDFANVPWSSFDVKMEVAVDIDGKSIILGEVPVSGAPYAMYAQKAGGLTSKSANTKDGDALFAVNDANGNPVFAVFADGIVVYVDDTDATKAKRSGFVVTGREATKGDAATEYFSVTAEGTQIYVDDADNQNGKALRSGFVVTGRSATKNGETADYLTVGDNGTTIYVDGDPDSYRDEKAMRSGFVVTGRSATKGGSEPQYFSATVDGTTIYIDDTSADKALRSGFVVTGREATKGGEADNYLAVDGNGTQVYVDGLDSDKALRSGFVVTGREASKAEEDTLFAIEGGYTRVYVDNDETDKAKRSGFVVTGRSATKDNTNIFNVSGEGNVDIKADFTVTDAITDAQEADTAAVQPQPGDTTETPAPVVDKPKNLFTVSSGNVQVGTEMVMMGDVTKKIEADTISIDSIEAEFPLIAKIIDRADTVSCAAYKPFVYGDDSDSAGYALLGIYSKGDLAKISATDARKNTVLLFDTYGNVTKYQRSATVAVLMPKGDSVLYIRPLKATSQTISFGLMKKNATEPYQYIKVEAEIEASAGVPYQVVAGSTEGGHVVINGTVAYGDQPTFEPVPNIGYKFVRWSDGNTRPKRTTTILDDYEISAEFERISYVVAVKSDNELFGTVSGEGTYLHGDTAMIEATPFTGYYFKNWSGTELNDSLQNSPSLALEITAELKLIANLGIMQYTITFDSDGGSEVAAITQDYDTEITAPADPQREGFRFRGWSPAIPERMPAEDLTIKAIWGINKYFITIDSDNGTTADTLMYDFGETVTAKLSEPTKEGYTFAGWDAALPEKMPAEDLIITAQWNINQYTMTFVDEDGAVIDSVRANYSDSVVVNNPEKEGYTFVGWSDTIPATMPATNLTFTAQWAINTHHIIYVVDSAVYQTDSANYNAEIKLIDEPTRTGYTFGGWSKAPETMPDSDVTISGSFMVNQYTAAFVKVAGDTTKVTANFGDSLQAPANPVRKGYAFRGWNVRIPATMPAQDTAFTAVWDTLNYSITYYNIEDDFDGRESYNVTDSFDIETPEKQGYEFVGWTGTNWKEATKEITIKNDTGNIELTANWASATMTYTVEHLQADLSGDHSILAATDTLTGKTDSLTAAVAKMFEGFTAQKVEQVKIEPEDFATVVVIFYDRQSYTLTWNANGGTVEGSSQHCDTVLFGEQVIARNADRTGYILSGWSGMDYGYMDMPATDLTVVAKWESGNVQYKVKHLREDLEGKFTIAQYDTLTGKTDSLTAAKAKQYEGFTAPDSVKQTTIAADGSTVVEIRYSRNSYELTWDANGGQMGNGAATMIDTIAYGDSIWMPAMAREGYTFLGWNDTLVTMPARDTTIKAQWEINKNTVVFKYSEDSVYQTVTQNFGTELELPEEPTKPNYTFTGWSDTLATIPAEDTTIIDAVWAINQHTVTFGTDSTGTITAVNAKNETVASGSKVDYGTVITLTPEPASGYFFIRWSDGDTSSSRTITADTTINAIFKNEFIAGGLKYTLTSASTVAVGKIDDDHKPIGTLTIPATMIDSTDGDFFSVTAVDTNAFKGCTELTTVIVSAGITEIAYSAFRECSKLASVSLPDGLKDIECAAFLDCGNLETINFPEGLTTIGLQAFFNCRKLTSVTFPTTFTTLGLEALGQTGLTSVNITSGLTTIDRSPFVDCYNMTEITVDAENKNYVAENGVLYNKDKTILIQYPCDKADTLFVVPDGVTHIERDAMAYSSNLKNVVLPNSVTKIDFAAFFDDYNLETLTLPSTCTTIYDNAFARCPKLTIYCQAAEAPANTSDAKEVLLNCKAIKIQSADETLGTVSIATPGGYGADGSQWFPKDSTINLVASPAKGYKLDKWTVADTTITSPYTISDTATITATWKPVSYSVTTISKDDGFGSVEITDGTMVDGGYEYGSEIELTATPWNYCHFVKWADDNSTDNPRTVTVSDEASYEAVFAPDTFTVTYNPNFEGATGSMAEQQLTCYDNQKLTPNAFAAEGYTFTGWATSANGGWAYGDSASTFINYNTTLYAIWIKAQLSASTSTFWNGTPLIASDSYIRSNGETYSPFFEKREWQLKLTNIAGDTVLATSNTSQLIVTDTVQLVAGKQYLLNAQLTYDGKLTVKTDLVVTASEFVLLPKGTNGTDGYNYSTYALFGRWPQTIKADDVTIYTDRDSVACGSLVYYLGSDGFYYVKCTENAYQSGYTYSNNTAVGLIGENSTKYFKVEPIKWCAYSDIRKTGRTLLIAENILASNVPFFRDSTSYHSIIDGAVQANNYHFSTIRAYINGRYDSDDKQERIYTDKGFLQSAFSNNAQSLIDTTYFSYTNDKLFLLTSTEANSFLTSSNRGRKATDYVKANFAEMSGDYGSWWLRDIDYSSAINMSYCVDNSGQITEDVDYKAQLGILPAMAIAMDNFSTEPSTFFFVDEKNGSYQNNGLTANSAFDNIDSALMRMNNTSANYTICINGTLTGAQAINGSPKAKSITLCGLNGNDTLNGGFSADNRGTVLTIGTSVPVTVKNLTITGGYAVENGGGISVLAGANLTIASGTSIVNDTAYYSGGGVYTTGTCVMTGGRISNNVITFNGTTYGGGVFADWNGKFTLQNGEISHNTSSYNGGGAAAGNGATFEMLGGQINDNSAKYGGGIYVMTNSSLTLNNGIVKHNSAQTSGGGVFTAYNSTTSLSCTISDNSASTGSGVYNVSKSFAVSGKAAISTNNNVYLASDATIIIAGALTADTVAVIKPYTYEARQILIGANGTAEDIIATQKERFVVTPEYNGNLWGITDDGYLQRVANIDAIVSQIEGMTESGTVVVTGYMEASGLTSIRNALWNLYDNNQDIRVTLDMSGVVGLTKIENFSKYGSAISNLKSIILPEGITSIDIQHCYNLESITLPSTLTEFDSNNLYENYNLQTVIVPDNSVFKVDNGAIYSKDGTKLIMHFDKKTTAAFNVPEGVTTICGEAFHESKISSITFPSTLRKIGSDAFYYCEFTSVEIPDSVVLDTYAFYGCGNLTMVKLPVATTQVKYCTFAECYSLASVELPEGVTSITNNAFDNCHALSEITLPASLQSIAAGTFNNCSSLTTVNYHGTAADTAKMNILDGTIIGENVVWNFDYALYVSPEGDNSNSGTSADAPLQSLDSALTKIVMNPDTNYNYIIYIDGTLRGPQALGDSLNHRAVSITLMGANGLKDGIPQDSLAMSVGVNDRVLTIGTSTPIIIRNLAITGGRTVEEEEDGGGIYVIENANANLTIADGALIADNSTFDSGGGIYVGLGNRALTMTGGTISGNYAYSCGGGVFVANCQFTMTGGTISHNNAENGGGAYLYTKQSTIGGNALITNNKATNEGGGLFALGNVDKATVKLTGYAKITSDTAYIRGGGVCLGYGITLAMDRHAEITDNTAGTEGGEYGAGGGVYLGYDEFLTEFSMTSGTIAGNQVLGDDAEGAGVYVSVRNFEEYCQFAMGDNAVIAADNDVYLSVFESNGKYSIAPINIMSNLTGEAPVATITPGEYIDSLQVLAAPSTIIKENYLKFAISNDDYTLGFNGELRPATYVDDKKYAVYQIEIGSQLNELIDTLNASLINCTEGIYISIANDLTLENHLPYDGDKDDNFRAFKGVFDGNGHTLTVKSFSQNIKPVSLVCVYNSGIIQNAKYEFINDTTFTITEVYGTAQGLYGGFCFHNYEDGIIRNCWNAASVHVKLLGRAGGICGANKGRIENCLNTARISGQWNKTDWGGRYGFLGGICGEIYSGIVCNCVNYGEVSMPSSYYTSPYESGSINGIPGAICGGYGEDGVIENCYIRDSCLYYSTDPNDPVTASTNMIYPATSVRNGSATGCGYFVIDSVNTTATLYAGTSNICGSAQTLPDYAEGDLLKALNGYVDAKNSPALKPWKKAAGKHAAVLNFGE